MPHYILFVMITLKWQIFYLHDIFDARQTFSKQQGNNLFKDVSRKKLTVEVKH